MLNSFLPFFSDGLNADNIKQASEQLNNRWIEFCQLLSERLAWLEYQNNIIAFHSQLQQLEQTVITVENWMKAQLLPAAADPDVVKAQLDRCKVRNSVLIFVVFCCTHIVSLFRVPVLHESIYDIHLC